MDYKDIKPCPFCGKSAKLNYTLGKAHISCFNPDCKIQPSTWLSVRTNRIDKLVKIWNERS